VIREMVNFVSDVFDMPTVPARPTSSITALTRKDVPVLFSMTSDVVRCPSAADLERHLFENAYFPPSSVFVVRQRNLTPIGAGLLINNSAYADPKEIDPSMPCFRLGAFGTEGMQVKRIKGMFSFLCEDDDRLGGIAIDLMAHAAQILHESQDTHALAAQVPSDAVHWLRFYQMNFKRQGGFPVLERALT
jgi:hypothetical protein